jgi:PAS domain S-box-containing protein
MSETLRILLVDDDELIRQMAGDLLRQEFPQARIDEVGSLSGLQQALEAGGFTMAITDYQLGWTDGLTVLRQIKSRYPDCPVVMFTGTGSEEIAVEAMKAGLEDYVLKSPHHIGRLTAAVHSVLAQAQQRRQLKESEARQRSLLNDVLGTSAVGLFILDADFRVVWVNEALERYFGLRRTDVIGRDKRQFIQERFKHLFENPEEFAAKVLQTYERNDEAASFDFHVPACGDQKELWLEHRSMPIRTGLYTGGRIEHYYDITDRKRAEAAARQNEASLTALVGSAMDAIIMVDGDHRILLFNGAAETMFGCAAAEAVGQSLDRFIPERFRAAHREHIKRYGETGQTNRVMGRLGTVYGLRSDGTEFPLEVSLSKGTTGEHTFYTAILRDVTERQRTEEVLRRSEERFKTIFEQAPMGIALIDSLTGHICAVNARFAHIAGRTVEEMTRIDWMSITHPDDVQKDLDNMALLNAGTIPGFQMEKRYLLPAGGVVWINMTIAPVTVEDKTHPRHLCMIEDITERKRVEDALLRERLKLQSILESASDGIHVLDETGNVVLVNRVFCEMLGYSVEEALRLNIADWDAQWTREELLAKLASLVHQRRTFETRHRRRDGTILDVEVSATDLSIEGKRLIYAASRDIMARKALEGKAQQANEQMTAMIQSSPMAITVLDAEGKVWVWNQAAERIFGWSSDEVLGGPLPTVPEEKRDEHRRICERVLLDEAVTGLELVRRRKDGSPVTISLSTAPLRNAKGRIIGIMGIMADITERKQMERHASRIERLAALGQLLGGIAHEIKNPLFVLAGRVQLLKEKLAAQDYDALPSDLEKIEEAAKRIAHVSERFLTLTRPVQPLRAQCDIRAILDATLDFLSNELMKNQIRLVTELSPDLPVIQSDPRQLQGAFLNLILNAIQAMAEHGRGTLTVSATLSAVGAPPSAQEQDRERQWIEVRIQDDGPGILPEHRPKLFEPFFSTKPASEGTGLGLWTVRTIVMALGGAVTCESEVGRGATFILRLPTVPPDPTPQVQS